MIDGKEVSVGSVEGGKVVKWGETEVPEVVSDPEKFEIVLTPGSTIFVKALMRLIGSQGMHYEILGENTTAMEANENPLGVIADFFATFPAKRPTSRFVGFKYKPVAERYAVKTAHPGNYSEIWPWVAANSTSATPCTTR